MDIHSQVIKADKFGFDKWSQVNIDKVKETLPSIYDYMYEVFPDSYIVAHLGHGYYGEAFLLSDGSVVKVTSSPDEAECIVKIADLQEKEEEAINIFPIIYEYGVVDKTILFDRAQEFVFDDRIRMDTAIFWYRREQLDDVPNHGSLKIIPPTWLSVIHEKRDQALSKYGIEIVDYTLDNWGLRPSDGELIFRDLMCKTEDESD